MKTLLFKPVDIALHCENRKISIENLDWVVKHLTFDGLALHIFLVVFCINFGLTLRK
jgi:hypothetical protein